MIIDTHTHLTDSKYKLRIDEVIENARKHSVTHILAVGMDEKHNSRAVMLGSKYRNVFPTVGIHPTSVDGNDINSIISYLEDGVVYAVGEIGIDLHWRVDNLEKQILYFEEQINLAIKYDLPIIVHIRNSFDEAYNVLAKYRGKVRGVFHCFSSNYKDALKVIDLGFYLGIGGIITFKTAKDLHEIVEKIDLKHFILETDSPYLSPVPYRGKTNEPAYTYYVAKEISKIKKTPIKVVSEITTKNAIDLFRLPIKL